jgi:ATP-dependent helicase/nuclease subunit A
MSAANRLEAGKLQDRASDPHANVFVTANAGSGKTKTLIDRVARLLLLDVKPERILCITYTKAAAAEMKRRLFQRLGDWSIMVDADLAEDLSRLRGAPTDDLDLSRARQLFAEALETPGGLKIQTIHAFCAHLLRRFPVEAGVSPNFRELDDAEASLVAVEARAEVARWSMDGSLEVIQAAYDRLSGSLDHRSFEGLFDTLAMRRFDIADWIEGQGAGWGEAVWRSVGFAGPSSVETIEAEAAADFDAGVWRQIAGALATGTPSYQATAAEIGAMLEQGLPDIMALCAHMFTKGGEDTPATWVEKAACMKANPAVQDLALAEQARLEVARERLRAAVIAEMTVAVLTLGLAYAQAYEAEKRRRGALDFADLIDKALKLTAERDDAAWVLFKLDGGIDHILVDEAQDTAPEQWGLVERLTGDFFSGATAADEAERRVARSLFVVGDVKQSIFSFQGADAYRVLEESHAYQTRVEAAGRLFRAPALAHSWRSTKVVLKLVDQVFEPESARRGVPPPLGEDRVVHPATRETEGCVDLWPLVQEAPADKPGAWDQPERAGPVETANQIIARQVVDEIQALVERGDAVGEGERQRPASYGDILILVRRRKALFTDILRALKRRGVPVAGADRLKLSEHILSDDLLALGRVILWPEDDLSLAALLRSPFLGLSDDDLFALGYGRDGRSLWSRLRLRADEAPLWREAADRLKGLMDRARDQTPYDLYSTFLAQVDDEGRSMRARMLTRLGPEAADAADAFLAEVLACEGRGAQSLQAVIDLMGRAEIEVKREMDAPKGEVRIMTVHGAKGLEAPIVFLPETTVEGMGGRGSALLKTGEGGFLWAPSKGRDCAASREARERREEREADEALRLLYVALTRAADRLVISGRLRANAKDRKPPENSWYALVGAAMQAAGADGPRLGEAPQVLGAVAVAAVAEHAEPAWLHEIPAPEARRGWASPSALAGRPRLAAASPLAREDGLGRFRRGELIHKLFELLPDLAPGERREAAEAYLARQADLEAAQRTEIAEAVLAVLAEPEFAILFGPGSRAEASIAGWGPGLPDGLKIAGRLDRLVVTDDQVLVCDFKTNRPAPPSVDGTDPAYIAQLAAYVAVLRGLWPGRPVRAALLWTDGPRLDLIPEAMIAAALEAIGGG